MVTNRKATNSDAGSITRTRREGRPRPDESPGPESRHPSADFSPRSVLEAVEADLVAWAAGGALRLDSDALQAAARALARRIDSPGIHDTLSMIASALKELRATLDELRVEVMDDDDEQFFGGLTAVSATVRDPKEPGPSDVGRQGRRGDGGSRLAADAVAATRPRRRSGARTG